MAWIAQGTDSDEKVRLLAFFRRNPGVIETMDGLARRLALPKERLEAQVRDVLSTGLLQERRLGRTTVVTADRERLGSIATLLEDALTRRAGEAAAGRAER